MMEKKRPHEYRDLYQYRAENLWKETLLHEIDGVKIKGRVFNYWKPLRNKEAYPENTYRVCTYEEYIKLTSPEYTVNIGTTKLMNMLKERMLTPKGNLRKNVAQGLTDDDIYLIVGLLEEAKEAKRLGKANTNISYQEKMFLEGINKRGRK